jgi:hypothetical protein
MAAARVMPWNALSAVLSRLSTPARDVASALDIPAPFNVTSDTLPPPLAFLPFAECREGEETSAQCVMVYTGLPSAPLMSEDHIFSMSITTLSGIGT